MRYRLEQIARLEDGWAGAWAGESIAPGREFVERFSVFLEAIVAAGAPWPWVYPTGLGELQADWDLPNGSAGLEADPDGLLSLHAFDGARNHNADLTIEDPQEAAAWLLSLGPLKGDG